MCALLAADDPTPAAASSPVSAPATVIVESTELASMKSIPILNSKKIRFSISSFAGCPADAKQIPALKELSDGTLTPKKSIESVVVPSDADLAVFAEYTNASGGNSVSCGRALRFHSEPGKTYHVRYTPPRPWHRVSCDMTIVKSQDGNELSVTSAHDALLQNNGFWKGSELNICAESEPPQEQPAS
jgi:hypothetical protein